MDSPRRLLPEVPAEAVPPVGGLDGRGRPRRSPLPRARRDGAPRARHHRGQPERSVDCGVDRQAQSLRRAPGAGTTGTGGRRDERDQARALRLARRARAVAEARVERPAALLAAGVVFRLSLRPPPRVSGRAGRLRVSRPPGVLVPAAGGHQHRRDAAHGQAPSGNASHHERSRAERLPRGCQRDAAERARHRMRGRGGALQPPEASGRLSRAGRASKR